MKMHGLTTASLAAEHSPTTAAPSLITLVVAVAGFVVVGLWWMATAHGRGGIGLARFDHDLIQVLDETGAETDDLGQPLA